MFLTFKGIAVIFECIFEFSFVLLASWEPHGDINFFFLLNYM